jgi:choline kinase
LKIIIGETILHSLFYARNFMDDDLMIAYGDIWFKEEPIRNIYNDDSDFVIAIDQDWEEYYHGRTEHPISEAENVHYDNDLIVRNIGKHIFRIEGNKLNTGEFMGLIKISKSIIRDIVAEFESLEVKIRNTDRFHNASKFQNAYLADFIAHLIDKGYEINCCLNKLGWYEVDTLQDFNNLKFTLGVEDVRK